MDAGEFREVVEGINPSDFRKLTESLVLALPVDSKGFDDQVGGSSGESVILLPLFIERTKDVCRHASVICALLDDGEIGRLLQALPRLPADRGEEATIDPAHTHAGEEVPLLPDPCTSGGIVAMLRMIERQLHETSEGKHATGVFYFLKNRLMQVRCGNLRPKTSCIGCEATARQANLNF